MPYLQQATNNQFGLIPVGAQGGDNIQINPYAVSSSEGQIFAGDLCILTSKNTVRSASSATAALVTAPIGVSQQFFAANAGSTTITNSNQCLIYDHPNQLFVIADTTSGAVGSSGIGLTYFIVAGAGSTLTFRSAYALSGAVQASSAGALKIVRMHPVENNVYATGATGAANVRKWVVALNTHQMQSAGSTQLLTT